MGPFKSRGDDTRIVILEYRRITRYSITHRLLATSLTIPKSDFFSQIYRRHPESFQFLHHHTPHPRLSVHQRPTSREQRSRTNRTRPHRGPRTGSAARRSSGRCDRSAATERGAGDGDAGGEGDVGAGSSAGESDGGGGGVGLEGGSVGV